MDKRIKEFLRRFLSLRNIVPFLIIIVAFIATFVTTPFGLQRDQILLALLAFLAIDALVERIEMLTNIEKDVGALKELVVSQTFEKDFLKLRQYFPRIENQIIEARKEIWISGITLDSMTRLTSIFNSKLEEGLSLRFLAIAPQENVVQGVSSYFGEDSEDFSGRVKTNLTTLHKRLVQAYPQQVEIRITNHRLSSGCFIIDPHQEHGYMTVGIYLYRTEGSVQPVFRLSKQTDLKWFALYLKEFEMLWSNAIQWEC